MSGEIASHRVLGRVQWLAAAWLSVGAIVMASRRGSDGLFALTVGGLVSIVAFRSLVGVVRRLEVDSRGDIAEGGAVRFVFRWIGLTVVLAGALIFGSRDVFALILGFSVTPLALLTEAGVQVVSGTKEDGS